MTIDITQKIINAVKRLKGRKRLKKILGEFLSDIIKETNEVAQVLYSNNKWEFYFKYTFKAMREEYLHCMKERLNSRGIPFHEYMDNNDPDERIWFYMTEDELETYYVMNKLVNQEK